MSAIHKVSQLQPSLKLLASTPCEYRHKVFVFYAPIKVVMWSKICLCFFTHLATISDKVVEMSLLVPF